MNYTEKEVENTVEIAAKVSLETPEKEAMEATKSVENPIEESYKTLERQIKIPQVKTYKKFLIFGAIILCSILLIYLVMAQYFKNHFYFGTVINGISVSGKTLEDTTTIMADELNGYTLNIKERGGASEQIKALDVGLKYSSEEFMKIMDSQNGYKWVTAWFRAEDSKKTVVPEYDENQLEKQINQLSCFKPDNIVEPTNPTFQYVNGSYEIINGDIGKKVDKDIFYSHVVDSLRNMETEIDLELIGCYVKPLYESQSQKTQEVKNILNKYASTKITYTIGDIKEVLDGSQINHWLKIDENFNITINENMVKQFINELSNIYNTVDRRLNFVTSTGETIKITESDYGRSIDKEKEIQYVISAIQNGKNITKEPIYSQNAFSSGNSYTGDTYVEISLEKQHIWFYKNGSLIVQGDVVTGNVSRNTETRKGIFNLKYKARNTVLRGPNYAVHVDFWMPFDGGIGIHDANWRNSFGSNIYKTNGSHGCVNSPYNVAKDIFNNIEPGNTVIVY